MYLLLYSRCLDDSEEIDLINVAFEQTAIIKPGPIAGPQKKYVNFYVSVGLITDHNMLLAVTNWFYRAILAVSKISFRILCSIATN